MPIIQIEEAHLKQLIAQEVARQLQEHLEELKKDNRFTPPKTWPKDFFERTAGSFADTNLERPPQAVLLPEAVEMLE